jgi:CRISPR system Cascade subunit CasC
MNNLYLDIHVIQTVPPSCLNRDDTGSPKTAIYGGVRRARVSSQSWKHAMRMAFREHFDQRNLGIRTKEIVDCVAKEIQALDPGKDFKAAEQIAQKIFNETKVSTADGKAKALFFLGAQQAKNLAKLALNTNFDEIEALKEKEKTKAKTELKNAAQAILNQDTAVDIALFGRMVADDPSLNSDAAAQVAHAISTHKTENEFDFFTAVDDRAPEDNAGAGMMGTIEFNSSTLYRYATVAAHELYGQLAKDVGATAKAVVEFVRAFVLSMPGGKMNTFANRTLPDAVYVTIRDNYPVNLVGAFENPVKPAEGYATPSIERLSQYAQKVYGSFASKPKKACVVTLDGGPLGELGDACDLNALLARVEEELKGALK